MKTAAPPLAPLLLTVREAGRYLGLSQSSVYAQIERGTWPVVRIGGAVRIARADIDAWVAEHREDWATGDPAPPMARGE